MHHCAGFGFVIGTAISFIWESLIVTIYTIAVHFKMTYTDMDMYQDFNQSKNKQRWCMTHVHVYIQVYTCYRYIYPWHESDELQNACLVHHLYLLLL